VLERPHAIRCPVCANTKLLDRRLMFGADATSIMQSFNRGSVLVAISTAMPDVTYRLSLIRELHMQRQIRRAVGVRLAAERAVSDRVSVAQEQTSASLEQLTLVLQRHLLRKPHVEAALRGDDSSPIVVRLRGDADAVARECDQWRQQLAVLQENKAQLEVSISKLRHLNGVQELLQANTSVVPRLVDRDLMKLEAMSTADLEGLLFSAQATPRVLKERASTPPPPSSPVPASAVTESKGLVAWMPGPRLLKGARRVLLLEAASSAHGTCRIWDPEAFDEVHVSPGDLGFVPGTKPVHAFEPCALPHDGCAPGDQVSFFDMEAGVMRDKWVVVGSMQVSAKIGAVAFAAASKDAVDEAVPVIPRFVQAHSTKARAAGAGVHESELPAVSFAMGAMLSA